jgi:tetratricopeptide (TPR) repeat protein
MRRNWSERERQWLWQQRWSWRLRRLWARVPPRSRLYARTTTYRSERVAVAIAAVAALIPLALLAGLAILLASKPHVAFGSSGFVATSSYLRAIAKIAQKTAVASGLAVLLLIVLAWCCRRAMLAWLVWRPGRIEVPTLDGAGVASDAELTALSAAFRERLAVLRLQSATPAPGAAPAGAFLDVLEGSSSSDPVGVAVRLLRSAIPSYALTVQGVLHKRESSPRFGITVQVTQQPGQAAPIVEYWAASWTDAARKAADGVTAAILPRTRLCVGPWAGWRGYLMPSDLLVAYERGAEHEQARRFDQSRDCYWEALRLDPTNLTIRLQLGQLQEKAGNPLAALTNYLRILAFANPGRKFPPRGLYRRDARREFERVLSLAKYRAIVLLGDGSIIEQWSRPAEAPHATPSREALQREFSSLLAPLAEVVRRDPAADQIAQATQAMLKLGVSVTNDKIKTTRIELIEYAYRAATELKLSLSRVEFGPRKRPFSRRTVDLTQICLERRYCLLTEGPADLEELRRVKRQIRWAGSRPGFWTFWWPSWLRRWQWHEHYNAACAYALAVRCDLSAKEDVKAWEAAGAREKVAPHQLAARQAVERLERALTTRDSGFAETWRDWVVREDPDLVELRTQPQFTAFKETYFPTDGPALRGEEATPGAPPAQLSQSHVDHRLLDGLYTRDLLRAIAVRQQTEWESRAGSCDRDSAVAEWLQHERALWRRVYEVVEAPHDWRVRQQLTELVDLGGSAKPLTVAFLRHEELDQTVRADPLLTAALHDLLDKRIADLREVLKDGSGETKAGPFGAWIQSLDSLVATSPSPPGARVTELCRRHAAVWQAVATWLGVEDALAETIRGRLLAQPSENHELWKKAILEDAEQAWSGLSKDVKHAAKVCHTTAHGFEARIDRGRLWLRRTRYTLF